MNTTIAEKISPKDDAFHGSPRRVSAEWWYFDGVLSNNYSFHIGIRTFSRNKRGRVLILYELYEKENIIFEKKKRFSMKYFDSSKEYPFVRIQNQTLLDFDVDKYKSSGDWNYHITIKIDDCAADLYFTTITQGFKIETKKESWTVASPKASIKGLIEYDGNTLAADGFGYHDHNWNYTPLSVLTYGKGWYWGKIRSQSFTITWANVLKRSGFQDLHAILNVDHNGFYDITQEKIIFEPKTYIRYKQRKIPSQIRLSFKETIKGTPINVDVTMDVKHIHFTKVLLASYWRYQVHINGSISLNDKIEYIDEIQIMEYLRMI